MKITAKTTARAVASYILKHYGNLENQAITIIYEEFSSYDGKAADLMDTVKAYETWEATSGAKPTWSDIGWNY